ncbi:hypothetical protein KP509_25G027600 [Ceratopteris richardii]|nr:hypothetical protein KP509_25G027600 [Ceratopteris richardii]
MKHHGPPPNAVTFCCMLKICGNTKDLRRGEEVHSEIITNGLLIQSFTLGGALVDMYVKCGALLQAKCVFENLPSHNVVSWTALITGFCEHKHGEEALECLQQMKHEGLSPNAVTFACILKVCGSLAALDKGMELHANIIKTGFLETDYVLGNTLLDMYCKCGYLEKAQQIFDELAFWDVVTWNMLITGYIRLGYDEKALICFADMKNEGFAPNTVTFSLILKACASIGAPELGRELHSEIDRKGLLNHGNGLVNALIDMYAKCGIFTKARQVFDKLLDRDAVSWNTLIAGYCHQSQGEEALDCFEIMQQEGVSPDSVTFLCALKACGITGATIKGIETHVEVVRRGNIPLDNSLENAVVDMYTKCGLLTNAREVFNNLAVRNSITWTSMIAGYCDHGYYEQALMYFEQMGCAGVSPDVVTLTCVLKACSRIMGASKAWTCYESLRKSCGIVPTIEHCTCIVQLFCLAGHYDKMIDVVNESPSSHMMASCFSLLSACRKQENAQLASFAFDYARSWVFKDPN